MVLYNDKMYIFGGTMDRTHFNDLFSFHFDTNTWKELYPKSNNITPNPRRRHKAVVYKDNMYIF